MTIKNLPEFLPTDFLLSKGGFTMNCKRWPALLAAAVLLSAGFSSAADQYNKNPVAFKEASLPAPDQIKDLSIFPAKVTLKGTDDAQQLILTAILKDGQMQDLTQDAKYEPADAKLVRITSTGRIVPLANGKTEVVARFGDKTIKVPVQTESCDVNLEINFGN